jgi:hypothetical protein
MCDQMNMAKRLCRQTLLVAIGSIIFLATKITVFLLKKAFHSSYLFEINMQEYMGAVQQDKL